MKSVPKLRQFELSRHATNQSIIRRITMQEVREAMKSVKYWKIIQRTSMVQVALFLDLRNLIDLCISSVVIHQDLWLNSLLCEPDPRRWIDFKIRRKNA